MNILAFLLVHFPFFKYVFPFIVHLHSPNQIQASSLWVCECVCVCVCVSNMSLISTWACCLLLRRSGSENKQSSSYLAWAGKVDSAEQAAPGGRGGRVQDWTLVVSLPRIPPPQKNGVNMDESRAKANALEKEGSSWQQADLDYPLD